MPSFDLLINKIEDPSIGQNFQKIKIAINDLYDFKSFWTVKYLTLGKELVDLDEAHVDTKENNQPIGIALPPDPKIGSKARVVDAQSYFTTKNCIVDGNGKNINGSSTLTLSTNDDAREFSYNGRQWIALKL